MIFETHNFLCPNLRKGVSEYFFSKKYISKNYYLKLISMDILKPLLKHKTELLQENNLFFLSHSKNKHFLLKPFDELHSQKHIEKH